MAEPLTKVMHLRPVACLEARLFLLLRGLRGKRRDP